MLGFDTETTGLSTASERAISYGFVTYRHGVLTASEHFFVRPDVAISDGAQRVHGVTIEELDQKLASGEALTVEAGLVRAVGILRTHVSEGAAIVGANVAQFDLDMLAKSYASIMQRSIAEVLDFNRIEIIDVVAHDVKMESREANPRRRGLPFLCEHYGVTPGGHHALGDAQAAVEVFMRQVGVNNPRHRPQRESFDLDFPEVGPTSVR